MVSDHGGVRVRARWDRRVLASPAFLVIVGGAIGTTIRSALESSFPIRAGHWPWTTFGINLTGSFILGFLLQSLALSGPDSGWRRSIRLGVGTGVMGGYTTYSSFSVETVSLLRRGAWLLGIGYGLASVLAGVGLAAFGMRLAGRWTRRDEGEE